MNDSENKISDLIDGGLHQKSELERALLETQLCLQRIINRTRQAVNKGDIVLNKPFQKAIDDGLYIIKKYTTSDNSFRIVQSEVQPFSGGLEAISAVISNIQFPCYYDEGSGYILDEDGKMICEVRGWGWIQYLGAGAEKMQDDFGHLIVNKINELKPTSPLTKIK